MAAYYNEFDPFAAAWLRNLIAAGLIAPGDVDERSIEDVTPDDIRNYTQCHFFAGIGGWSYALRLAGWPDDRPVWTGSCPCQPFSAAGKGAGFDDERHLWPHFDWLISQCRPAVVFGEQVASKDGLNWLDLVQADMEAKDYTFAAVDLCAAGVGAPHIRQRLFWVADADGGNACAERLQRSGQHGQQQEDGGARELADTKGIGRGSGRHGGKNRSKIESCRQSHDRGPGPTNGHWRDADWLGCTDGKWRPVIACHVGVADGLPDVLVRSSAARGRQEEKEEMNGQTGETSPAQGVSGLWEDNDAQDVRRADRGLGGVHAAQVLRPRVHGGSDAEGAMHQHEPQPHEGEQDNKSELRNLREGGATARSPQGQGPFQQLPVELDDVVSVLPSALSLAELHGRRHDQEALYALCGAICEAGSVQFSPDAVSEIWRSLGREEKDRIRLDFGRIWVARQFTPLSKGETNRVMRLRGYGNAIVPQVAAAFIESYLGAKLDDILA